MTIPLLALACATHRKTVPPLPNTKPRPPLPAAVHNVTSEADPTLAPSLALLEMTNPSSRHCAARDKSTPAPLQSRTLPLATATPCTPATADKPTWQFTIEKPRKSMVTPLACTTMPF